MQNFLTDYMKYVMAILGSLIAMGLLWAAKLIPGVVTCTVVDDGSSCTVLGLVDYDMVYGLMVALITGEFVRRAPANTINGERALSDSQAMQFYGIRRSSGSTSKKRE